MKIAQCNVIDSITMPYFPSDMTALLVSQKRRMFCEYPLKVFLIELIGKLSRHYGKGLFNPSLR